MAGMRLLQNEAVGRLHMKKPNRHTDRVGLVEQQRHASSMRMCHHHACATGSADGVQTVLSPNPHSKSGYDGDGLFQCSYSRAERRSGLTQTHTGEAMEAAMLPRTLLHKPTTPPNAPIGSCSSGVKCLFNPFDQGRTMRYTISVSRTPGAAKWAPRGSMLGAPTMRSWEQVHATPNGYQLRCLQRFPAVSGYRPL